MQVIKKDGTLEQYNEQKIINACNKAARRAMVNLTERDYQTICNAVWDKLIENNLEDTEIYEMHNIVESVLEEYYPLVAKMYKEYRNYKKDFVHMMDRVYERSQAIRYIGDKSNANTDSALVATKRSLIYNELSSELYKKFFLTLAERQAMKDGYIYIHDRSARLDTFNCFRRDTTFITKDGIKSFYDFNDGDTTYVLSHKGIWRKATVHKLGWQPIQKVTFKKGIPTSREKDIYCTPNHRWILKGGKETTSLSIGDILYSIPDRTKFDWDSLSLENKRLWCKGFARGDGAIAKQKSRPDYVYVHLCDHKNKYASRFGDCGYSVTQPESYNGDYLVSMLSESSKKIPWLELNHENIIYYINGLMCADGSRNLSQNPDSEFKAIQVTGALNEDIYDLLNMSGYYVSSTNDVTKEDTNYGKRSDTTIKYVLSSAQEGKSAWRVVDIQAEKLNPKAEVWCLDVEEDHSFILEGGIPTGNCDLMRVGLVMKDGFEMGNVWYNEPNSLDTAFDVMGDIILSTAAQQYGGFTVPEVDKILAPYAEKSYNKYKQEYFDITDEFIVGLSQNHLIDKADKYATEKVRRDFEQGWQGIEYKLNTVGSSRGDYPFVTMTIGLATDKFGKMATITLLNVHAEGQGKNGFKRPVLFPKIVFLYDKNLHGDGSEQYPNADVFNAGIDCSSKTMYPDWLSLTGNGYVPEMYKKYGKVVSPMGCVDGKEIITYKFQNNLYVESFERMWNRLSDYFEPKTQFKDMPHLYMDLNEVEIYDTEKGFVNTKRIIRNVSNNWVDVHLSNGRRLLCTTDHPFEVLHKGAIQAKNLKISDKMIINSNQYNDENIIFNTDKAWLLGFMLCDGCYQSNHIFASIAASGEDEIEEKFKSTFPKYFGIEVKTILQERDKKGIYKDLAAIADDMGNLQHAINYFTSKFGGINKANRHIPNEVFSWNYEAKLAFMAGMIDADGYINDSSHGGAVVQIGSTNKELALQQMALAQALGMPAKIYHNHYTRKNPNAIRYRVEFYAIEELLTYIVCEKKCEHYENAISTHYNTYAEVIEVIPVKTNMYSYDVSTDSEHFEVSGIYSHNCRAFLSPWYEKGGIYPLDENDMPVFEGRCNLGVVSLHLPMILAKSRQESRDFYEVLDEYLELIRGLHKRTYDYIGELRASVNPIAFCEGGLYGGNLKPEDKIKSILPPMTMSYGITALNELQRLYNGKSIREDGKFALEVMKHIQLYVDRIKEEDHILYAIYGTPAESLCGLQVEQFRKIYGIIENVSDKPYVSNSFHCHVSEDMSPIEKQDKEERFWDYFNGGKIQYCRYNLGYNKEAIKTLVLRAMEKGFYEGVNLAMCYCEDCGYQQVEMDVCPKCGSKMITKIDRMNGYLGFTRVHGETRYNEAKNAEIVDRKSM